VCVCVCVVSPGAARRVNSQQGIFALRV